MPPHRRERKGKRQRFYARNVLKTTLVPAFLGVRCIRLRPHRPIHFIRREFTRHTARIHPALITSFADDICGTLARLIAYLCTLALIAILDIYLWDQLPGAEPEFATQNEWSLATRSAPAFAVSQFDLSYKTNAYQILRHPEGGRKDVLRWTGPDGKPAAELGNLPSRTAIACT